MVALKGDKEIGDKINKIIGRLAEANDLQEGHRPGRLQRRGEARQGQGDAGPALQAGDDLRRPRLPRNRAEGDDLLGDAYEYLMRHFATESGKSKGQFYTPAEVSRILAKVVGIGADTRQDQTVYDPTCGSGSLLLKAADEAPRGITIYGQEKDNATWALAKMNMILHGNETAEIRKGDTLTSPQFTKGDQLKTFDFVVPTRPSRSSPGATASRTSTAASSSARRRRRTATTPSCSTCSSRSRAPARRGHPAARRPLPRPRRGHDPRELLQARLHQGHHRPAAEPLLRHRHPGVHRRARQGERAGAPASS